MVVTTSDPTAANAKGFVMPRPHPAPGYLVQSALAISHPRCVEHARGPSFGTNGEVTCSKVDAMLSGLWNF